VFFDAVGTLLHSDPPAAAVYAEVGRRYGSRRQPADVAARFAAAFRRQEEVDLVGGLRTDEAREVARWRAIVADVLDDVSDPECCFQTLYDHFARPTSWRPDPDAEATLAELARRGYRLGIASNFDGRLRQVTAGIPALRPVTQLVISAEVGWRKPAPSFFATVCLRVGLPPGQVLLVGDDWGNDFEGGRAAGLAVALFDPRGRHPDTAPRLARLTELLALVP
jgi:putative hydrolase of the HAD superfamily